MKWISVKEKLPNKNRRVLFYSKNKIIVLGFFSDDGWTEESSEGICKLNYRNVTHWMPLPNPPKEK